MADKFHLGSMKRSYHSKRCALVTMLRIVLRRPLGHTTQMKYKSLRLISFLVCAVPGVQLLNYNKNIRWLRIQHQTGLLTSHVSCVLYLRKKTIYKLSLKSSLENKGSENGKIVYISERPFVYSIISLMKRVHEYCLMDGKGKPY